VEQNKKINHLFVIGLALIMISPLSATGCESEAASYSIDEAWIYPVRPDMDEWESYIRPEQKLKASYVPKDILKSMTTRALVETVLTYPLLIDMYAFNTEYIGYKAVSSNFYGLPELASRTDAITTLKNYIEENYPETDNIDITYYYANTLIDCITQEEQ
jgi:hypothetical protein